MDTIFWLVVLFIVGRSFWRYLEQVGAKDENDGEKAGRLPDSSRPLPDNSNKTKLNIPEYLTKGEEETVYQMPGGAGDANSYWEAEQLAASYGQDLYAESGSWDYPAQQSTVQIADKVEAPAQETARKQEKAVGGEELFDDLITSGQVIKGMVWSQILGSRGGLRHRR
ncbi:MAG: hypothetical protein GX949_07150 [Peptococcaceae bacterium]|jgi:hypothetical protein|nr:hypothetical protein [Peptococcaceae bacterium]